MQGLRFHWLFRPVGSGLGASGNVPNIMPMSYASILSLIGHNLNKLLMNASNFHNSNIKLKHLLAVIKKTDSSPTVQGF